MGDEAGGVEVLGFECDGSSGSRRAIEGSNQITTGRVSVERRYRTRWGGGIVRMC